MRAGPSHSYRCRLNALHENVRAGLCRDFLVFGMIGLTAIFVSLPVKAQDAPKAVKSLPEKPMPDEQGVDPDTVTWRAVQLQKDNPVFKDVEDSSPKERLGHEEKKAFEMVVNKARNCSSDDLQRHFRAIDFLELLGVGRPNFLRELVQIKGRLIQLRKIENPALPKEAANRELYEAWVYSNGESAKPVCFIFSRLPNDLWAGDNLDELVVFEGYYFKLMSHQSSKKDDDGKPMSELVPLLVGQSIRKDEREIQISKGLIDESVQVRLDKEHVFFKGIDDRKPMRSLAQNREEYNAFGVVVTHANRFKPEVLAKHSHKEVVFADLIGDLRDQYLRELLHVEGRLVRLRKLQATERLRDTSTIKEVYEGWIYHENEHQHPMVVVFTDLPPDIKTGELLSYRVSFDGYYFKLLAYQAKEKDKEGKPVWRVTPLLIGKSIQSVETGATMWSMENSFVPAVLLVVGVVLSSAFGMTFWFRRADKKIRQEMQAALTKENPFDEAPKVQAGTAWNRLTERPSSN